MKRWTLLMVGILIGFAAGGTGCAPPNRAYTIWVTQPAPDLCYVDLTWITSAPPKGEKDWGKRLAEIAQPVARAELKRLGLQYDTLIVCGHYLRRDDGFRVVFAAGPGTTAEVWQAVLRYQKGTSRRKPKQLSVRKGDFLVPVLGSGTTPSVDDSK